MKELVGRITISHPQRSDGKEQITVHVVDECSNTSVVEVAIGLAEFTQALTGLARVPCTIEVDDTGRVGKMRQVKIEVIRKPDRCALADGDWIGAALRPFELDGWVGERGDMTNYHRSTPHGQSVAFIRYVDRPAE